MRARGRRLVAVVGAVTASFSAALAAPSPVLGGVACEDALDPTCLRADLDDLAGKIEEQDEKDGWDKLEAASGALVALIGAVATGVYASRQRAAERAKSDREVRVQQVEVLGTFIPHLGSADERVKKTALLAISALGNEELALRLAELYPSEGSVGAVSALTLSASEDAPREAARATLASLFATLRSGVVQVSVEGQSSSVTGFVARADGVVSTVDLLPPSNRYLVRFTDGSESTAESVQSGDGLKMLRVADARGHPLPIERTAAGIGESVVALGYSPRKKEWRPVAGRVTGVAVTLFDYPELGDDAIEVEIESEPGFGGAPVMNTEGRVIGLIYAAPSGDQERDRAFLLPASRLLEILDELPLQSG